MKTAKTATPLRPLYAKIQARAFHEPLQTAGLVPPNCKLLDVVIGVDGAVSVVYEAFLDVEQIERLGAIFVDVAGRRRRADEARAAVPPHQIIPTTEKD